MVFWQARQQPQRPLLQLAYISMVSPSFIPADIRSLAVRASESNAARDLTGVLFYNGRNFFQILEGEAETVRTLLQAIRLDPRHENLSVQFEGAAQERQFPDWSMRLILPLDCDVPTMPPALSPPLARLWRTFGALR